MQLKLQYEETAYALDVLFDRECQMARQDNVQEPFSEERARWVTSLVPQVQRWKVASFASELGSRGICFENTFAAADDDTDTLFTEGITLAKDGRWYHHAFLTAGLLAIETTWRYLGQNYTGVPFSPADIVAWQGKGPSESMLWGSEALWLCGK